MAASEAKIKKLRERVKALPALIKAAREKFDALAAKRAKDDAGASLAPAKRAWQKLEQELKDAERIISAWEDGAFSFSVQAVDNSMRVILDTLERRQKMLDSAEDDMENAKHKLAEATKVRDGVKAEIAKLKVEQNRLRGRRAEEVAKLAKVTKLSLIEQDAIARRDVLELAVGTYVIKLAGSAGYTKSVIVKNGGVVETYNGKEFTVRCTPEQYKAIVAALKAGTVKASFGDEENPILADAIARRDAYATT